MDMADPASVEAAIQRYRPWAVINAAGYVKVDLAETEADRCFRENTMAPTILALACIGHALRFVTFSSDLVFDGKHDSPYVESDPLARWESMDRARRKPSSGCSTPTRRRW